MKRLLIWSATLILTFGLLVTATRAIGGSIKSSKPTVAEMLAADSYLGPHGWCWRDICPEQTFLWEAMTRLNDRNSGFEPVTLHPIDPTYYWMTADNSWTAELSTTAEGNLVQKIDLHLGREQLNLGKMILWFGNPISIEMCLIDATNGSGTYISGEVFFDSGIVAYVTTFDPSSELRVTPTLGVLDVMYLLAERSLQSEIISTAPWKNVPWKGFAVYPQCEFK